MSTVSFMCVCSRHFFTFHLRRSLPIRAEIRENARGEACVHHRTLHATRGGAVLRPGKMYDAPSQKVTAPRVAVSREQKADIWLVLNI